jgi:hypothetical protein
MKPPTPAATNRPAPNATLRIVPGRGAGVTSVQVVPLEECEMNPPDGLEREPTQTYDEPATAIS